MKRFFVFDLHNARAITYFKNENSTGSPSDVITLNSIIEVRREDPDKVVRGGSVNGRM